MQFIAVFTDDFLKGKIPIFYLPLVQSFAHFIQNHLLRDVKDQDQTRDKGRIILHIETKQPSSDL